MTARSPETPQPEPQEEIYQASSLKEQLAKRELAGGIKLDLMPVGSLLQVSTKSRNYVLEHRQDGWYLSGHPKYCPEPTRILNIGSTFGGSSIMPNNIGRGMILEYSLETHKAPITSSEIEDIKNLINPEVGPTDYTVH